MNRPSSAERARTMTYGLFPGELNLPSLDQTYVSAYAADDRGRPLFLAADAAPLARAVTTASGTGVSAALRVTALYPVAIPDRVRGRAWLEGRLSQVPEQEQAGASCRIADVHPWPELLDVGAGWSLLRMEVAEVRVQDGFGFARVEPEEYGVTGPDPFVAVGDELVTHLDRGHGTEARVLYARLDQWAAERAEEVRLVALDRYGLWLRVRHGARCDIERLTFDGPACDLDDLRRAFRRLRAQHMSPR